MFSEPTPDEEEEMIEKCAKLIIDNGLENVAETILPGLLPLSFLGGEILLFYLLPLSVFWTLPDRVLNIFEKRENITKLVGRVQELKKVKTSDDANKLKEKKKEKRFLFF